MIINTDVSGVCSKKKISSWLRIRTAGWNKEGTARYEREIQQRQKCWMKRTTENARNGKPSKSNTKLCGKSHDRTDQGEDRLSEWEHKVEELQPAGMRTGAATMEISIENLQKAKNTTVICWSHATSGPYATSCYRAMGTSILSAAILMIARTWNQPRCSPTGT